VLALHSLLGRRGFAAVLALVAVFVALTSQRNRVYANNESIWRDTVARQSPQRPRAKHLAGALYKAGRVADAITWWQAALRIRSDDPDSNNNSGLR